MEPHRDAINQVPELREDVLGQKPTLVSQSVEIAGDRFIQALDVLTNRNHGVFVSRFIDPTLDTRGLVAAPWASALVLDGVAHLYLNGTQLGPPFWEPPQDHWPKWSHLLDYGGQLTAEHRGESMIYPLHDNHVAELIGQAIYHADRLTMDVTDPV